MRKQEKTVIAILGMHRSGTSLAGQMIYALGVPMGANLVVANEYNERGYFEDSIVVKIHDDLLTALGRPWHSINSTLPLPCAWMDKPETNVAREKLRAHIESELQQNIWAVKDPRMARFLPLWKELAAEIGFRLVPLLCVRSPQAVAKSLVARDHFPLAMGELLWTMYNFEILEAVGTELKCVLCYEDWFSHPEKNLTRLAATLQIEINDERCRDLASTIIDAKLRHHVSDVNVHAGLHVALYQMLQTWAEANTPPQGLAALQAIIRDGRKLFSPWYESREESYLAETEKALLAERSKAINAAQEYLKAYQVTEIARVAALEALKGVERERDVVAEQAKEFLVAYQTTVSERDMVALQAQQYRKAYQRSLCHRVYRLITFKWVKK